MWPSPPPRTACPDCFRGRGANVPVGVVHATMMTSWARPSATRCGGRWRSCGRASATSRRADGSPSPGGWLGGSRFEPARPQHWSTAPWSTLCRPRRRASSRSAHQCRQPHRAAGSTRVPQHFPGFIQIAAATVAETFVKSIEGAQLCSWSRTSASTFCQAETTSCRLRT